MENQGWAYFKKGMVVSSGKQHYLINWKSRCGQYSVELYEQKYMVFVDKSKLRPRKICKICESFLSKDMLSIGIKNL